VLADFDAFLIDHAACERKASATGMAFVVRYPDRPQLLGPMIEFAREELEHFQRVYAIIEARGLTLTPDEPDPYVGALQKQVRGGRDERLIDRLVMGAVVEARGCERLGLVADALAALPTLREYAPLYVDVARSEARHRGLFLRLARQIFDDARVDARLEAFLAAEAAIIETLPVRAALH
jgi:tRNA-(ms[2]io[6]A)-hydroxylase